MEIMASEATSPPVDIQEIAASRAFLSNG